jgi:hypothetical protein
MVSASVGQGRVKWLAVDLDDRAPVPPEEVDLVAAELRVGLGLGKARSPDQLEEPALR